VQIAECIYIEDVGEAWCETEILEETRKHVPWVTIEERCCEVDTECRNHGSDKGANWRLEECFNDFG